MKIRASGIRLLSVALAASGLLSVASATPALALPSYCEEQAWDFCDPDYARGTPEWRACVKDYVDNCNYPGCIRSPYDPTICIAYKGPKVSKTSIMKMLKTPAKS